MAEEEDEGGPRRTVPAASGGGGGSSPFKRKIGPLPAWEWMIGLLVLAVGYYVWKKKQAAATAAATTDASTTATDASGTQTPPFIIQNYTTTGTTGPAGPAGATGATGPAGTGTPPATTPVTPPVKPPATPTTPTAPVKTTTPKAPLQYRVKAGDNLTEIAKKYGTTWQALYDFNTSAASGRPASTIATLKARGPNKLVTNELILIPQ